MRLILVPAADRTLETTLAALRKYQDEGGRVFTLGNCFRQDESARHARGQSRLAKMFLLPADGQAAFEFCRPALAQARISRPVEVTLDDGRPAWASNIWPSNIGDACW